MAGPGQLALRQHHRQFRRRAVRLLDHPLGADIGADRCRMRDCRRQPDAAACGCQRHQAARRTAPTDRRAWCRPARAPRPSPRRRGRRTSMVHPAATAAPPGFPAWSAGCSAAATRWRARRLAGVSPVRVSIDDGQPHLLDRPRQVARDVGGQRLQRADVQCVDAGARRLRRVRPGWAGSPASVLPPPVGAISSTLSPARAASSIANWCWRGVHPCPANQSANGSGNVPAMPMFYWLWHPSERAAK